MRLYIVPLLIFLFGCKDKTALHAVSKCGTVCYTSKTGRPDVGQCKSGFWICPDDNEEQAICDGEIGPTRELCDSIDNDCNGTVDDHLARICSSLCGFGIETCTNGVFDNCTAPVAKPEICNGVDDNCNGRTDEPEGLPIEYCYNGPAGSIQLGECRPGVLRCGLGLKTCQGSVTPTPEICDGKDNNCNGSIDEGLNNAGSVDIVFVIDNSCSMDVTIGAVKTAANSFASAYGARADLRWGLVTSPDPDPGYDAEVRLYSNMGTAASLISALQNMGFQGGGQEPTLDALHDITSPSNPLGIAWKPGSRHVIILFSDEHPQSYRDPLNTGSQVLWSIRDSGDTVYVFTDFYSSGGAWPFVLPTGLANIRTLTSVSSVMETELKAIINEVSCQQ